jgi:hypothetical protein
MFFIEVTIKSFSNYVSNMSKPFASISVYYDGENYYSNGEDGMKKDIE